MLLKYQNKFEWRWPGNMFAKNILEKYYLSHNLPHSIILAGSGQVGKLDTAIDLAHLFLCENGQVDCQKCSFCRNKNYEVGNIVVVSGDKLISIDEVRDWRKNFAKSDFDGNYRFLIIDKPERMNKESANAFLKLLEEPGKNVIFLMITHKLHRIIDTIRSRSMCLYFNRLTELEMNEVMEENVDFDRAEMANMLMGRVKMVSKMTKLSKKKYVDNVYNFWRLVFAPVYVKQEQVEKILKTTGQLEKVLGFWEGCGRDMLLFRTVGKDRCWWQDDKLFELYSKINISNVRLIDFLDGVTNLKMNISKGYAKRTWLLDLLIRLYT